MRVYASQLIGKWKRNGSEIYYEFRKDDKCVVSGPGTEKTFYYTLWEVDPETYDLFIHGRRFRITLACPQYIILRTDKWVSITLDAVIDHE